MGCRQPIAEFKCWVYQIVVDGNPVLVIDDHQSARALVEKNFKGSSAIILPIAVFKGPNT